MFILAHSWGGAVVSSYSPSEFHYLERMEDNSGIICDNNGIVHNNTSFEAEAGCKALLKQPSPNSYLAKARPSDLKTSHEAQVPAIVIVQYPHPIH